MLKQLLTTAAVCCTSIGSVTRASYQSTVPVTRLSSGCAKGELNVRPIVQVSPLSFFRFGLPTISAAPPGTFQVFRLAWKSEALLPPQSLICAEHSACSCARLGLLATL